MSNPYFDWPVSVTRFAPRTKARAEDVNAALDLASLGFDGVYAQLLLKAPIASPAFTGTPTVPTPALTNNSTQAVNSAWVHSLFGSLVAGLPLQTGKNTTLRTNGTSASWAYLDHVHVREVQASGVEGGACGATTTHIRTLNTVVENTVIGASLASDKVTLPAGTYKVHARAPAYSCNGHRLTLYDVTGAAALLVGPNAEASAAGFAQTHAFVSGVFTITVTSEVRLDHYTEVARATNGLGKAIVSGAAEVYTEMELWRTA